jgi:hypothetical protein
MASQRTKLLLVLVVAAAMAAVFSASWEARRYDAAYGSLNDLAAVKRDIADLSTWKSGSSPDAPRPPENLDLNTRIRNAANDAGLADQIANIEPGQPRPIRDTDYTETLVSLHLSTVNLRQLVTFLHRLSVHDASIRTKAIDLSAPTGVPADAMGDLWTADVTLGLLIYSPRAKGTS